MATNSKYQFTPEERGEAIHLFRDLLKSRLGSSAVEAYDALDLAGAIALSFHGCDLNRLTVSQKKMITAAKKDFADAVAWLNSQKEQPFQDREGGK